ncbi:MAG: Maf family nucleotide pyrophosphatase [Streptosporangiaceae bacterium]
MTTRTPRLVLASSSPARRRLLRDAGFAPDVDVSGVSESFDPALDTASAVCVLAERKASAVAGRHRGALVLGCDSLLDLGGAALGKPASPQAAVTLWRRMAGAQGTLHTGHCLIDTRSGQRTIAVASTLVRFGTPGEHEIAAYVATGEPGRMAGAFSIDGFGAPFVEGIDGDWGTVVGPSLPLLRRMLAGAGVAIADLWPRPAGPLIRDLTDGDRDWLAGVVTAAWGLPVVSLSGPHDVTRLPGLVAQEEPGSARAGVLTYRVEGGSLEVVTLNSLAEGRGIGTALLAGARQRARRAGQRLWLTTGNDNVQAIGFYQRRGMDLVALHRDFADQVRKIKQRPAGAPGGRITFRHAIELEYPAPVISNLRSPEAGAHREDSTSAIFAAAAEGSSASCSSSPQDQR